MRTLSLRELNRALLGRELPLEQHRRGVDAAVERLVTVEAWLEAWLC